MRGRLAPRDVPFLLPSLPWQREFTWLCQQIDAHIVHPPDQKKNLFLFLVEWACAVLSHAHQFGNETSRPPCNNNATSSILFLGVEREETRFPVVISRNKQDGKSERQTRRSLTK